MLQCWSGDVIINKMAFTKKKREQIHAKYSGHCAYCGDLIELKDMQIDHIIPKRNFVKIVKSTTFSHLTENDVDHDDNLNPSCRFCNKRKDAFDLEFFRSELAEQINRLNKYSASYRFAKKFGLIKETQRPIVFYFESSLD